MAEEYEQLAELSMKAIQLVFERLPKELVQDPLLGPVVPSSWGYLEEEGFGWPSMSSCWTFVVLASLNILASGPGLLVDWERIDEASLARKELMESPGHEFWEEWFQSHEFTFLWRECATGESMKQLDWHRAVTCASSHDLFSSSALAIDLLLEALDAPACPPPRLDFDPDGKTVRLDGEPYSIGNDQAYRAYKTIVDADGELVPGLGKRFRKPDRLFRDYLPEALRQTYDSKAGNGGGYWLRAGFCRKSRDRP